MGIFAIPKRSRYTRLTMIQMHATARACANIALAKYWGKRPGPLNLPAVGSLSITLSALMTRTSVTFDPSLRAADHILFMGNTTSDRTSGGSGQDASQGTSHAAQRIVRFMDRVRAVTGISMYANIVTHNNFPTGSGLASSASGFAALALAATQAAGVTLPLPALSALARQGSGSAARSIFGGFVEMHRGDNPDGSDAVAVPLLDADAWPLHVVIAVTSEVHKTTGSTEGMQRTAATAPFYGAWLDTWRADVDGARAAVLHRDFSRLADVSEHSCLKMHGLMLSAQPGLVYWNGVTVDVIHAVRALRQSGVPAFFTIDAGPQVKVICLPESAAAVRMAISQIPGVLRVIESDLGPGAQWVPADGTHGSDESVLP